MSVTNCAWRLGGWVVLVVAMAAAAGPAATQGRPGDDVVGYLDHVIDWYRRVQGVDVAGEGPQEVVRREAVRESARRVVGLGFDYARAEAAVLEEGAATRPAVGGERGAGLARAAAAAEERVRQLRAELDRVEGEVRAGGAATRPSLGTERDRLAAQLNLAQARLDVVREYSQFMSAAEAGDVAGGSLTKRVSDLEAALPEIQGRAAQQGQQKAGVAAATAAAAATPGDAAEFRAESAGVFALVGRLLALSGRMGELNGLAAQAGRLHEECERLRGPVRTEIAAAVRSGGAALTTTGPTDPAEVNRLAERFKRLAAVGMPLGEQEVLLASARQELLDWHAALGRQYERALKYLLVRLGVMAAIIGVLVVASELWRRATYRYVHDPRRRRQLMFVRRMVVAVVVVIIVVAGVMTEFGSLATFAGLITAGIAVALQTVILSGVAYFFFIGRFGVRVGDRVTISGITGDVLEIGILRLYMAELAGTPTDLHPTGRVVVFSNSVLFQPSAFYKQMPGANYVWHEVAFTLAPDTDVKTAEGRLVGAVERVYRGYEGRLRRGQVSSGMRVEEAELRPEGRLRFAKDGVELVVRYPVEVREAAEADDRVTRELLAAIEEEPKLKLAAGGRVIQGAG